MGGKSERASEFGGQTEEGAVALADRRLFPRSARTVICRISVKSFMLFLLQVLQLFRLSSG